MNDPQVTPMTSSVEPAKPAVIIKCAMCGRESFMPDPRDETIRLLGAEVRAWRKLAQFTCVIDFDSSGKHQAPKAHGLNHDVVERKAATDANPHAKEAVEGKVQSTNSGPSKDAP